MGAFSIELRRRGGKTINDIYGVQSKPAIGEWFECQVDNKTVTARVVAIRHHPRTGFETILAQEVEPRAGGSQPL
jgi:hypothetical protein